MTAGRAGRWLIAIAVLMGSAADRVPVAERVPVDGYTLLAGDFHVHSFFGDGGLAPWELAREARRKGLDVIAVTNHNQLFGARVAARAAAFTGEAIVIVGEEITASTYHMIGAGLTERVDWRQPASAAVRAVQSQGGVAIAAHPVRSSWTTADREALGLLDGSEAAHPLALLAAETGEALKGEELLEFRQSVLVHNPGLAAIGSSDFHFGGTLGLCRTFLFVDEVSQAGVLDAIRAGRTVARDANGRLTGDPMLVALVQPAVKGDVSGSATRLWSQLAVWLTLTGLVLALVFR
jgi:hypothetical protein